MNEYKISVNYTVATKNISNLEKIKSSLIQNQIKYYKFLHPSWTHYVRDIEIEILASSLNKNQKILEIGSGDGYIASLLKYKYGLNVIASDLEPRFPQYINVLKVDGQSTYFQDKEYDAIISLHVLEHIEDIDMAMNEFKRLLKDDGKMYHLVPSKSTMLFTSLMQPLSYIRAIYLYLNGYFISKYLPFRNRNILRFIKSFITTLNPFNLIWGSGHGVYNRLNCFKNWSISNWKKVFIKNNLEIIDVKQSNITYSMHKIFPFKFLYIRKLLVKMGGASANLFIVKKS
jgi:2-polyprenyl-3-methyl-5-hydroxy-6-metoxy-1,4-benzoquinol methylase